MARRSAPIVLRSAERSELERLIRSHSTPQHLARRARMIVMAADGIDGASTAQQLGVWRKGVSFWRARWLADGGESAAERAVVALACERPEESGLPISQWSASDLAREVVRRGIVTSISPRSVGRFLKRIRPQAASRAGVAHAQARS